MRWLGKGIRRSYKSNIDVKEQCFKQKGPVYKSSKYTENNTKFSMKSQISCPVKTWELSQIAKI